MFPFSRLLIEFSQSICGSYSIFLRNVCLNRTRPNFSAISVPSHFLRFIKLKCKLMQTTKCTLLQILSHFAYILDKSLTTFYKVFFAYNFHKLMVECKVGESLLTEEILRNHLDNFQITHIPNIEVSISVKWVCTYCV